VDTTWTVRRVLEAAAGLLAARGIDEARLDAEWLLAHALGARRLDLYLQMDRPLDPSERARYRELVKRRGAREPVAYIVGEAGFYSLDLHVTPDVLVPRPETELLVDRALDLLRARSQDAPPAIVADIGAGSGAIAVAVARFGKDRVGHVHAVDTSDRALAVARRNAQRHGVADRVTLHHGDLLAPLEGLAGGVDLLLSNPPYVAEAHRALLSPEVRREPAQALFAPEGGLAVVRRLLEGCPGFLAPGGVVLVELGFDQARAAGGLATAAGLTDVRLHADLGGHERVLEGRAPAS
jgi:release factor glutamine methyltransferase